MSRLHEAVEFNKPRKRCRQKLALDAGGSEPTCEEIVAVDKSSKVHQCDKQTIPYNLIIMQQFSMCRIAAHNIYLSDATVVVDKR